MQPDKSPRMLMCPPDYFGIEYEINPWMNVTGQRPRHRAEPVECALSERSST